MSTTWQKHSSNEQFLRDLYRERRQQRLRQMQKPGMFESGAEAIKGLWLLLLIPWAGAIGYAIWRWTR